MAAHQKKSSILQPLHRSTGPVLRKSLAKYGFAASDILLNWRAIVGDDLAGRAVPHRISWPRPSSSLPPPQSGHDARKGGTLIVQAQLLKYSI